jgi:hypothetical protein
LQINNLFNIIKFVGEALYNNIAIGVIWLKKSFVEKDVRLRQEADQLNVAAHALAANVIADNIKI